MPGRYGVMSDIDAITEDYLSMKAFFLRPACIMLPSHFFYFLGQTNAIPTRPTFSKFRNLHILR